MDGKLDPGSSFEAWYREHYRRLLASVVVAARDVDVAREVTDEAFVRALERWPRVSGMDSPVGWTYAVACNVLRRHERRRAIERRLLRSQRADPVAPPELSVEVWDAVASLGRRARMAVALRYLLGMREGEIATAMGIKSGTVARMLHDARAQLAERLGDDGGEQEPRRGSGLAERT